VPDSHCVPGCLLVAVQDGVTMLSSSISGSTRMPAQPQAQAPEVWYDEVQYCSSVQCRTVQYSLKQFPSFVVQNSRMLLEFLMEWFYCLGFILFVFFPLHHSVLCFFVLFASVNVQRRKCVWCTDGYMGGGRRCPNPADSRLCALFSFQEHIKCQ